MISDGPFQPKPFCHPVIPQQPCPVSLRLHVFGSFGIPGPELGAVPSFPAAPATSLLLRVVWVFLGVHPPAQPS